MPKLFTLRPTPYRMIAITGVGVCAPYVCTRALRWTLSTVHTRAKRDSAIELARFALSEHIEKTRDGRF